MRVTVRTVSSHFEADAPVAQDCLFVSGASRLLEPGARHPFDALFAFCPRRMPHRHTIDDAQIGVSLWLGRTASARCDRTLWQRCVLWDAQHVDRVALKRTAVKGRRLLHRERESDLGAVLLVR